MTLGLGKYGLVLGRSGDLVIFGAQQVQGGVVRLSRSRLKDYFVGLTSEEAGDCDPGVLEGVRSSSSMMVSQRGRVAIHVRKVGQHVLNNARVAGRCGVMVEIDRVGHLGMIAVSG